MPVPNSFSPNTQIKSAKINEDFDYLTGIIDRSGDNTVWAENDLRPTRFVSKTLTQPLVNLTNQSTGSWTDLDFTGNTSSRAFAVVVELLIRDAGSSGGTASFGVRKNGETDGDQSFYVAAGGIDDRYYESQFICGVDTDQILEYLITATGSGTADVLMRLVGYYEYID